MKDSIAVVYCDPQIALPSLTELRVFVWEKYSPQDVYDDGSMEAGSPYIEDPKNFAAIKFEVLKEELTIVTVISDKEALTSRAAYYLAAATNGVIRLENSGLLTPKDDLIPLFGEQFDLDKALERIARLQNRLPSFFEKNLPFLRDYVKPPLKSFQIYERKSLFVCSTHRLANIKNWCGKGSEGYTDFAAADVPDDFGAGVQMSYSHQEWFVVLWKKNKRKFWFAAPYFHAYNETRNIAYAKERLENALQVWESDLEQDVLIMEDKRVQPLIAEEV